MVAELHASGKIVVHGATGSIVIARLTAEHGRDRQRSRIAGFPVSSSAARKTAQSLSGQPSAEAPMNNIICATRRRFAISRFWLIGLAAAGIAALLQPTVGMAQWSDNGGALIDAASGPRAYSAYLRGGQPLRPSDASHILRDWGLRLLSGPTRSATSYQAIVRDAAGQDLLAAVDPYDGRILNLDVIDRALGIASFPRSDADESLGHESNGPSSPPISLSHGRRKTRIATGIVSPQSASRAPVRETTSRRLAAVEPSVEIRAPKRVAVRSPVSQVPRPSAGLVRPRGETAPGQAASLTPTKAQLRSGAVRTTSPVAHEEGVSTSASPAPPSVSEAQKIERQHTKPAIPADAGFD